MATPPFIPLAPPPLPLGWTEHISPSGQTYYFNAQTNESTYIRPLPAFPPQWPPTAQQETKKKDKPLTKTPIPGTDWIRVKTTQGNLFYSHKIEKRSVWTIPDEIKEAVIELEKKDREDEEQKLRQQEEELARIETERVKAQILKDTAKRKAQDPVPVDEVVISKKVRVEDDVDDELEGEGDEDEDTSEEEEWQKEAAAQLAAEAEEERLRQKEEREQRQAAEQDARKAEEAKNNPPALNMPTRVDLSLEEGKALFKTLLREKDVNPLHPWDTSLPLFISDPRYVLLPSVSARREAFDEYCRDRAREIRRNKVTKEKEVPKDEFDKLLREEVKSTRTSWSDFRRQWKKDRRFYAWGRDEREREKRFREYLKGLGEKKRIAAEQAELDFFALLRECGISQDSSWKDVKRKISGDLRYDTLGSSSLREELFNTFMKASVSTQAESSSKDDSSHNSIEKDATEFRQKKKEKKERAVREREQKVKSDMTRVEAEIGRSRMGLNKEEGEREFGMMLTDAIRDPQMTWETAVPQLSKDPRFTQTQLPVNQQLRIFHDHVENLRAKHLTNLHCLFESHAPSLATSFTSLPLDSIISSLPVTKLGFSEKDLRSEFDKWQRTRTTSARKAFDDMMSENSFLEFWCRLGKIGGEGLDETIQNDDIGEEEDEGERVDMKKLAKAVDVTDIRNVLKSDKRYIVFDHVPEQRERWIRDYVSNMKPPQLSVHVPERS